MHIEDRLNTKNLTLLCELRIDFEIDFVDTNNDYCEVIQKNQEATIYYNSTMFSNESIAHELLHIYLNRYKYIIGNHIFLTCQYRKKLGKVFIKFLCDYIENCFDHYKMYPSYIEMGYSPEKFIVNGLDEKCSIEDITNLKLTFLRKYKSLSLNKYIGFLISISADHVENDYNEHLKLLKDKDSDLFDIVSDFWKSWEVFDIENIDIFTNSDMELVDNFISNMEEWIKLKKIK